MEGRAPAAAHVSAAPRGTRRPSRPQPPAMWRESAPPKSTTSRQHHLFSATLFISLSHSADEPTAVFRASNFGGETSHDVFLHSPAPPPPRTGWRAAGLCTRARRSCRSPAPLPRPPPPPPTPPPLCLLRSAATRLLLLRLLRLLRLRPPWRAAASAAAPAPRPRLHSVARYHTER